MADKKTKLMAQFYEQCQSKGYTNMNDPTQSLKAKVIATDLKLNYGDIVAFYEKAKQSYERQQAEATEAAQVAAREAARKAVDGTLLVTICGAGRSDQLKVFVRPDRSFYTTNNSDARMEGTPKITVEKGGVLHTTYNPAQAVYTSATVGGITTGGVHYTKESYSQSVSKTGTGYIKAQMGSDDFTVEQLIMSQYTEERFKRDTEYNFRATNGIVRCNRGISSGSIQSAISLGGSHEMKMAALSQALDRERLSYDACLRITELLDRVIRGPFPPSDEEIYTRAAGYAEQNDSVALKRAKEMFDSISDYRDAAKRAAAASQKYETVLQMEKEQAVLEKEASKKRNKKLAVIIAPIAAVLIVATILISNVVKKNQEEAVRLESYNTAISMVEAGRYDEAIAIFSDLGDYKDSVQQIELAEIAILDEQNAKAYANATALMEDGQYKQAKDIFEKLGEYQDSQEMVVVLSELIESEAKEEDYQTALQLLSNNNYTNNSQVGRLLTNLGEYKDSVSILRSFDYLKQGNSANDVLVFNSSDCYEGTGFPSLEFYLGEQVSVDTKQSQDITVYRYENIGNVISCDYFNNDGFLYRYGFTLKSMIDTSGNFYQFVFFDDHGNALKTSVTSSSGKWYRDVVIIYSENVQTFLDSNGLTLN